MEQNHQHTLFDNPLFLQVVKINKGWSTDEKYYVQTSEGESLLVRIHPAKDYVKVQKEFLLAKQIAQSGIPMAYPISQGLSKDQPFVYSFYQWIDGSDCADVLPSLSVDEQYHFGLEAGKILKKIHQVPIQQEKPDWAETFKRKMASRLDAYHNCGLKIENDHLFLQYINQNIQRVNQRKQVVQHGDYHVGNMIIDNEHNLSIIDFNRVDIGDSYEDFKSIVWSARISPDFARGQIDGYFDSNPPDDFFALLLLYLAYGVISSLPWSIPYGEEQIQTAHENAKDVMQWYEGLKTTIPTWYHR